jgi:hypothetical protein
MDVAIPFIVHVNFVVKDRKVPVDVICKHKMREQIEFVIGGCMHIHIREDLAYVNCNDVVIQGNDMLISTNSTRTVLYMVVVVFELGT